jgi:hypothetical protein
MKPDLRKYNAFSLRFETSIDSSQSYNDEISRLSPPDEDGDRVFADLYDGILAHSVVSKYSKAKGSKVSISFAYVFEKRKKLSHPTPGIDQLMAILSATSESCKFGCQVGFDLKTSKNSKPLIPLPIKLTDFPHVPFNSVQGMHLKKVTAVGDEFDIFIEGTEKGELYINLIFELTKVFHNEIATDIVTIAYEVAKGFIVDGIENDSTKKSRS